MSGNTFGEIFTVTTFGESHGPALGCVVDGVPPLMELDAADIQAELDRRKPGTSQFVTQRKEGDEVEILSGVFEGKTTGTPIGLLIRNTDQRSKDYGKIKDLFRPGHADATYMDKYGIRDYRGGGRSSARETAARVAAGAIAKKWLKEKFGLEIVSYLTKMGDVDILFEDAALARQNPFNAPNQSQLEEIEKHLAEVRLNKDSVGGQVEVVAKNVPKGLGSPVFGKLDARIAYALMGVNAVKAVEIGEGVKVASMRGSQNNDAMRAGKGYVTNHAGGILGGISTGEDIVARVSIKPTPSIAMEQDTIDVDGNDQPISTTGRHDPCVALRAGVILESMLALVLIDEALKQLAYRRD